MTASTPHLLSVSGIVLLLGSIAVWWLPSPQLGDTNQIYDPLDELCIVAPAHPYDPAGGLALHEPRPIPADARCPVCGMFPSRFPAWAGQVIFSDGAAHFFDSPVNLLVFLRAPERYSNYTREDIVASYVNDVASSTWTDARTAHYVHGSNALGPMREGNLPTFAQHEAAERFARERGGVVLALPEVSAEILNSLVISVHHHHD